MTNSNLFFCAAIALLFCESAAHADAPSVVRQNGQGDSQAALSQSVSDDARQHAAIKYIGNCESHKFHRPSCPFARIMALNKRVQFNYRTQAVACGHAPCRYCLPPRWTVVRGKLLTPLKPNPAASLNPVEPVEPAGPADPAAPVNSVESSESASDPP